MFVTDTHPLVWFATGKLSKLSDKVLAVFRSAGRKKPLFTSIRNASIPDVAVKNVLSNIRNARNLIMVQRLIKVL
jgi:hypothetical protein